MSINKRPTPKPKPRDPAKSVAKPNRPRDKVAEKANKSRKNQQGNKGQQGRGQQGSKMFGALGGYGGVSKKDAKQLVNSTIRPTIQAMIRDKGLINQQATDAIDDSNSMYDRTVSGLNNIYGAAGQGIAALGQNINTGFQNTMGATSATDAGAQSQIASNNSAAQQAIQSELARLGLDVGMGVDSNVIQDGSFAQNAAVQTGANNQANLGLSQNAANTVTGMLGGMIQGSHASNLGQAANTRDADVADIGRAKRDDLSEVMSNIQEMRKSKPGMIRDMLMQLQAQGFDQWQAIQALNMDRRSLNHSIGMDRAGMAEDGSYYSTLAGAFSSQAMSGAPVGTGVTANGTPQPIVPGIKPPGGKKTKKRPKRTPTGSRQDEYRGPLAGGYY